MRAGLLAFGLVVFCASPSFAQQCLHGPTESPEQAARRRKALSATRLVNTLQSQSAWCRMSGGISGTRTSQPWSRICQPRSNSHRLTRSWPGWRLTVDVSAKGYWFAITDTTDACGFRYVSTEDGLILSAEPIR